MKLSEVYVQITEINDVIETIKGEKFYFCTAVMDEDKIIKIRCSEHQLPEKGLYKITCFLGSLESKRKTYTFLDMLNCERVDEIPKDVNNIIYVGGIVAGSHELEPVDQSMSAEIKVDIACMSGNRYSKRRRNLVKATIIDSYARKIKSVGNGDILEGYGSLIVSKAGNLYVILDKVTHFVRKNKMNKTV